MAVVDVDRNTILTVWQMRPDIGNLYCQFDRNNQAGHPWCTDGKGNRVDRNNASSEDQVAITTDWWLNVASGNDDPGKYGGSLKRMAREQLGLHFAGDLPSGNTNVAADSSLPPGYNTGTRPWYMNYDNPTLQQMLRDHPGWSQYIPAEIQAGFSHGPAGSDSGLSISSSNVAPHTISGVVLLLTVIAIGAFILPRRKSMALMPSGAYGQITYPGQGTRQSLGTAIRRRRMNPYKRSA